MHVTIPISKVVAQKVVTFRNDKCGKESITTFVARVNNVSSVRRLKACNVPSPLKLLCVHSTAPSNIEIRMPLPVTQNLVASTPTPISRNGLV